MINKNLLKDFKLIPSWGTGVGVKCFIFELQHNVIPICFKTYFEVADPQKESYYDLYHNSIHKLYNNVIECALTGKPTLPTTGWHTINYVPYWCKEKQCWCCLAKNGKEMFDEESVKINDPWDELNMQ